MLCVEYKFSSALLDNDNSVSADTYHLCVATTAAAAERNRSHGLNIIYVILKTILDVAFIFWV